MKLYQLMKACSLIGMHSGSQGRTLLFRLVAKHRFFNQLQRAQGPPDLTFMPPTSPFEATTAS
jgi:hypothetical protein